MKKIIYTALSGIPSDNSGGPNKVINQIISKIDLTKYRTYYLSKNSYNEINNLLFPFSSLKEIKNNLTTSLFSKSILYQKIFTSSTYLKYFFNQSIDKISKHLNNEEWDIIHSHDVRCLFGIKQKKSKIVLSIHSKGSIINDMAQLYGYRNSLLNIYNDFKHNEIKTLEISDAVTFPSQAALELFFRDIKNDSFIPKVEVVYNGIDIEKINQIKIDKNFLAKWKWLENYDNRIVTVASHIKVKNIDKILMVLYELNKMKLGKYFLISIGSGPLTKYLKKLAFDLKVSEYVLFIDFLQNDEILKLMKFCNIYISLSERVIFDLVILEALSCGMNVFASDNGGNREIIDNSNGYLINENNIRNIAELIFNSKLDYSTKAKDSVKKFDIMNVVNNYVKLYDEN
jgi:glycosyltransferase involved in cell wall biosynthesis